MRCSLLGILLAALVLVACGEREVAPPRPAVQLTVDGPQDAVTVDADSVDVHGRVDPPTASVRVDGNEVSVEGGTFATSVDLDEGSNVIDVQAGAPRRPAAMTAVRVTRLARVEVPAVSGESAEQAAEILVDAGLDPEIEDIGVLLDDLLPGEQRACGTDPPAGSEVPAGTVVVIGVARGC